MHGYIAKDTLLTAEPKCKAEYPTLLHPQGQANKRTINIGLEPHNWVGEAVKPKRGRWMRVKGGHCLCNINEQGTHCSINLSQSESKYLVILLVYLI